MSGDRAGTLPFSFNREEWRRKRDARRILLAKVRARRRLTAGRPRARSNADEQ
jgi:hypothetical protein